MTFYFYLLIILVLLEGFFQKDLYFFIHFIYMIFSLISY